MCPHIEDWGKFLISNKNQPNLTKTTSVRLVYKSIEIVYFLSYKKYLYPLKAVDTIGIS